MVLNRPYSVLRPVEEGSDVHLDIRRNVKGGEVKNIQTRFAWLETDDLNFIHSIYPDKKTGISLRHKQDTGEYTFGSSGTVRSYFRHGLNNLKPGQLFDVGAALNQELTSKDKEKEKLEEKSDPKVKPVTRISVYTVHHKGKSIGVVRIPSFVPGDDEATLNELAWLKKAVERLENSTDVLILDTLGNSGGSIFFATKIMSLFTGRKTMRAFDLRVRLSKTIIDIYQNTGKWLSDPKNGNETNYAELFLPRKAVKELEEARLSGEHYATIPHWDSTQLLSNKKNTGMIFPDQEVSYTKPILLLSDQFSASAAESMAKIFQTNERAIVKGSPGKGLGGVVIFRQTSISGAELEGRCTVGHCWPPNGQAIENIGVLTNIRREISSNDLTEGDGKNPFQSYSLENLDDAHYLAESQDYSATIQQARKRELEKKNKSVSSLGVQSDILKNLLDITKRLTQDINSADISSPEKLNDFSQALRDTYAEFAKNFNKLIPLSESELNLVSIPLPKYLQNTDPVLKAIYERDEVIERLFQMAKIGPWNQYPSVIEMLNTMANNFKTIPGNYNFGRPPEVEFGQSCDVALGGPGPDQEFQISLMGK